MLYDIVRGIRESIRDDMKEKFGLSENESEKTSAVLSEKLKDLFNEAGLLQNVGYVRNYLHGLGLQTAALREKLNRETIADLGQKAGLSEEKDKGSAAGKISGSIERRRI